MKGIDYAKNQTWLRYWKKHPSITLSEKADTGSGGGKIESYGHFYFQKHLCEAGNEPYEYQSKRTGRSGKDFWFGFQRIFCRIFVE